MARGRKGQPQLAGLDYLFLAADRAVTQGQPYAKQFKDMVEDVALGNSLGLGFLANRPLKEPEASPVAIILAAIALAQQRRDRKSADEIVLVGLSLLAKWSLFLGVGSPTGNNRVIDAADNLTDHLIRLAQTDEGLRSNAELGRLVVELRGAVKNAKDAT